MKAAVGRLWKLVSSDSMTEDVGIKFMQNNVHRNFEISFWGLIL